MLPTEVRVGWIFRYAYLWDWQHREGREEGDKDSPCLVLAIVMTTEEGAPVVRVLPITHTPPANPADAIEIPADVKARLRLDAERSWVVLTESNRFAWPGPDLRSVDSESGYYGALTPGLFAEVKRRFVAIARGEIATSAPHQSVPRSE
ncbi:plasmid maintenance toxin (PemK-like) [Rhizobium leguminosarum]|uniref:plasmid maintenance toxin (PemK-like) n=1 Tax=Rhizobium leguminosarum TaxID=384 RepID=UPI001C9017DD|nr:plasmid maintenance toxin (PemK-like) [Rhizobium leguminosarum]MBY3060343.1 plasmid maintenance toxin (PemK-like) [Rhizobium leguminosarum]